MTLKLGPHYLEGGAAATSAWLVLRPAVAKFCFSGFELAEQASPRTLTIGRPEENWLDRYPIGSEPAEASAARMVLEVYAPLVDRYPKINAWEGPNEISITPYQTNGTERMAWYATFLAELGRGLQGLGRRAVLGAWAVGTPEFDLWRYYRPVLEATRQHGAILSRHSYGPLDEWYAYRHRKDRDVFRTLGYDQVPLVISECGIDNAGGMPGGWAKLYRNENEYWEKWLKPFEMELEKDTDVLGATVFTVGTGFSETWRPFNVGQTLVGCLAQYKPKELDLMYIATLVTGANEEDAHIAFMELHRWIAEHDGSPRGFKWPMTDWPAAPFECKAGPRLRWYHAPTDAVPYRTTTDARQLRVFKRQGDWFQVLESPEIWVQAEDCEKAP